MSDIKKNEKNEREENINVSFNSEEMKDEQNITYETSPAKCSNNQIINLGKSPQFLPSGKNNNSTICLRQGDRIDGEYYARLVTKYKIPRLQLCKKCSAKQLVSMEEIRLSRSGENPEDWIKEAWALRDDNAKKKR